MRKFRKTSVSTLINILGMSVAFAAAMILLVRVRWDFNYDRNFAGHQQVFRMENDWNESGAFSIFFNRASIEITRRASSNIESVGTMAAWSQSAVFSREGNPGGGVTLSQCMVDSSFFDVFSFKWVEGSAREFSAPETMVLERSAAKTLFGDEPAVGQFLQLGDGSRHRVVGVYEDLPRNSSFAYQAIASLRDLYLENTNEWSFSCYLKLRHPDAVQETRSAILDALMVYFGADSSNATDEEREAFRRQFRVVNLHDAYFQQDVASGVTNVNKSMSVTLLAIAILLIVIAIINFVNFAFAEIPFRIKSINTRKVLGEERGSLVGRQLLRAGCLALVAFALACVLLRVVAGTSWASAVAEAMTTRDFLAIILPMLGVTLCSAVVAGLAPALYSTAQPAALVLKGSYAMSVKGKALRNGLVGLQFVLSFLFILLGLFISVQLRYMQQKDLGFRKEQVLQVWCGESAGAQFNALQSQLLQNPAIEAVAASDNFLVSNRKMAWGRTGDDGTQVTMEVLPVTDNFLDFFDLQIVDGRGFLPSDTQGESGCFIVNEAFLNKYPTFHVGSYVGGHQMPSPIVGVVKDFNSKSLQHEVTPLVLYNWGSNPWRSYSIVYVRVAAGADFKEVSGYIRDAVCALDPTLIPGQVSVRYLDEWIGSMYNIERMLQRLVTIASLVALLIAIIGIIGLVFFETQFLRKEIAVRRVNGATVSSILQMINRKYLLIAGISFAVAAPLAYILMNGWRSGFAYQAPIPVWIFVVALLIVAVITLLVVTLQSWQAANANPVESLKNE